MLHYAAMAATILTALAWLSALVHAVLLVAHRREGVSVLDLIFRGHLFFAADTWKPSGQRLQRRFIGSGLLFFAFAVIAGVLAVLSAP